MKIHIQDSKTINQIKEEFHNEFSFLKIEFFNKPHKERKISDKKDLIEGNPSIAQIRTTHEPGDIKLDDSIKVSELEDEFLRKYGLFVQVFRRSGKTWLETSRTDNWTLREQNEHAKESEVKYEINTRNFETKD